MLTSGRRSGDVSHHKPPPAAASAAAAAAFATSTARAAPVPAGTDDGRPGKGPGCALTRVRPRTTPSCVRPIDQPTECHPRRATAARGRADWLAVVEADADTTIQ